MAESADTPEPREEPPRPTEPLRDTAGRPIRRRVQRYSLAELLAGMTPENMHGEFDSSPRVGNEMI